MEKEQGGTQVTFGYNKKLFAGSMDHSFVELLETHEHGRVLLMDQEVQFAESDEYRYHEMLVHPVMMLAGERPRVLILGGGDGLAAREVLKWGPSEVDIVDYDEQFVRRFGMDLLRDMNQDSFFQPEVTYICADALDVFHGGMKQYDVILVDLPDPDGDMMEHLYKEVLKRCSIGLKPSGYLSIHVGGLVLQKDNPCWEFVREIRRMLNILFPVSNTHVRSAYIPSFMNPWGFLYVAPLHVNVQCDIHPGGTRYWDIGNPAHTLFSKGSYLDKDIESYL